MKPKAKKAIIGTLIFTLGFGCGVIGSMNNDIVNTIYLIGAFFIGFLVGCIAMNHFMKRNLK